MPPHGRRRAAGSRLALVPLLLFVLSLVTPTLAVSGVLGIDLGTEYIKAAMVKPGIPLEIVLTKDSRRKEMAALAFKPAAGPASSAQDVFPERAYGADAQALAARFPGDVYPNVKPLLGLSTHAGTTRESPVLAGYQARYPGLALQQCSATRDTVCLRSQTFAAEEEPFSVEELLAMQLQNVKSNAENMAGKGSTVRDVVITVPPFWTVEEKRAVETAAELAGLRVLALTTDGLAVGIHYGTTRTFPVISEGGKPEHHLVFDMGAGSTSATIMRFQGRSVKDVGKYNKTVQEIQVLGAGWDTTLGGDALNQLLMEDIVQQLAASKPMQALGAGVDDIHRHGRTMARLWKEATRIRQVLSANTETQATIEGIYNGEVTFKYKLARAQFETLAHGYAERVQATISRALAMAKLELADLDSVILHGGATRTPLVQKALESTVKKPELLKTNVNSDEAAAFGAAFRAAGISPSFRVKEIRASEAAIQPVEMTWVTGAKERTQRLFVPESAAGKEKQVPFNTLEDFTMTFAQVVPEEGDQTRPAPVSKVATTNMTLAVKELKDKYGCEAADVSTHFAIRLSPESALPEITRGSVSCEVLEEKKPAGVVEGVKNLFGFGSNKDEQAPLKDAEAGADAEADASAPLKDEATATDSDAKATDKASKKKADEKAETPSKDPVKKTRVVYVGVKSEEIGQPRIGGETLTQIRDRMKAFDTSDKNRRRREGALNDLEAYTYRLRDLVEEAGFVAASTDKARAEIAQKAREAGEWIYGDGADAKLEEFQSRLKDLKALVKPIANRTAEAAQRDGAVKTFRDVLNSTKVMVDSIVKENTDRKEKEALSSASAAAASAAAAESTAAEPATAPADDADAGDEESPTTEAEPAATEEPFVFELPTLSTEQIAELEKLYDDANTWLDRVLASQAKLPASQDPAFTVGELERRSAELQQAAVDLLTKQMTMPKKNKSKKPKKSSSTKTKSKKSSTSDPAAETATAEASDAADAEPSTTTSKHDEL